MSISTTADTDRFDEAVDWFNDRIPTTQAGLEALDDAARRRAFTIAGAFEAETVQLIFTELAKSIEAGTPYEDFAKQVAEKLDGKTGPKSAPVGTAH
jgi:hypothetical protein